MSSNEAFAAQPESESSESLLTPEQHMGDIIAAITQFQQGELEESVVLGVIAAGAQASGKVAGKIGQESIKALAEMQEGSVATKKLRQ